MSTQSTPLSDVPTDLDSRPKAGSVKPEGSPDVEVKAEEMDNEVNLNGPAAEAKEAGATEVEANKTSTTGDDANKTGATGADATDMVMPTTPLSAKRGASEAAEGESPTKKTKGKATPKITTPVRQRKAPAKTPTSARTIPTTMEELSAEDRLLMKWKAAGKSWSEITDEWVTLTGSKPAKSTLPNRYSRLRANIMTMTEEDQQLLVQAKAYVEKKYEAEKWEQIAQRMQELGSSEKFSTTLLQKQYHKMEASKGQEQQVAVGAFEDVAE